MFRAEPSRLSLTLGCLLLANVSFASTSWIVGLRPGVDAATFARSSGATLDGLAASGQIARFTGSLAGHSFADVASWQDSDQAVGIPGPEIESRGTVLPVVGSRDELSRYNAGAFTQIGWSPNLVSAPGKPSIVAVLDTGLAPLSPQWFKVIASGNFVERGLGAYDQPGGSSSALGHGTMVAGLVEQIDPKARFIIVRVADSDGNASVWSVLQGLDFAVRHGADIINISLGGQNGSPALDHAIAWAASQGVIVVAPIGNESRHYRDEPSAASPAVCVAGLDATNLKANFSNYSFQATTSAPAVGLASCYVDGRLGVWSGTSFASPLVAGSIALAKRWNAPLTPTNVRSLLLKSGDSLSAFDPQYSVYLGTRLNVARLCSFGGGSIP